MKAAQKTQAGRNKLNRVATAIALSSVTLFFAATAFAQNKVDDKLDDCGCPYKQTSSLFADGPPAYKPSMQPSSQFVDGQPTSREVEMALQGNSPKQQSTSKLGYWLQKKLEYVGLRKPVENKIAWSFEYMQWMARWWWYRLYYVEGYCDVKYGKTTCYGIGNV